MIENENIAATPVVDKEELKRFYKEDLLNLIKKVFLSPMDGTYSLFASRTEKTYFHSLILILSASILCAIFTYFAIPSDLREYVSGFSIIMKSMLVAVVFLLLLSASSFGIKLLSGKPNFKNEMLTGGLSAIPFVALVLLLFISSKFILDERTLEGLVFGGFTAVLQKAGFVLVLVFYILLMFINILKQSLRAAGTKDVLVWYLSPAAVLLSFYFTGKIVQAF